MYYAIICSHLAAVFHRWSHMWF